MSAHDFLRSNKTDFELILSENRQLILNKCYEKKVVSKWDYKNLKSIHKGTEIEHVTELVDKVMGKGETTCERFLDLLQNDADIKDTFTDLKDTLLKYTASLPKPVQEMTATAKTDDVAQENRKRKQEMDSSDDVTSNSKKSKQDYDELYPLKSKPTGLCFIINNVKFKNQDPRNGSDIDAKNLAKEFSRLGFRVLMCENQTKDQMEQVLKCLSASDVSKLLEFKVKEWSDDKFTDLQEVPTHGDAFICCILTHGNMGVVYGVDGEHLAIKDIKKMFKATDLSPLTNKPKVFLIQACQGGALHGRVVLPDGQSDGGKPASIPEEADFLVGMSTVEDYESYRHPDLGSWYIQSLCKQLNEGCPSGVDMYTILERVNKEMSLKEGQMWKRPGVILKQMSEIRSTLRMKLVFSPPPN
ncbi:caspase-8-like [Sphaeramia orbicularis]|uniref:Caspase-8-like n=1 Tax=Sphaeramia orbicularis TaxID=375764 RepID=A0A673AR07_9TELE|nr:caspase-8-like [Sphaeramia orbicularis]